MSRSSSIGGSIAVTSKHFEDHPSSKGYVAIVDDSCFDNLSRYKWTADVRKTKSFSHVYAFTSVGGRKNKRNIYMHRMVLDAKPGEEVDHINGNKIDNRKVNLRLCTHAENTRNRRKKLNASSHFLGVYRHHRDRKWYSHIMSNGCTFFLGSFDEEEDAAIAYNVAAQLFFGAFAKLNDV